MIRAIVRPNKESEIVDTLERDGFVSLTKTEVFGRGKQGGITVGDLHYDELPKTMIMLVVEDRDTRKVCEIIQNCARTGKPGDGKIFVTPVEEAYTIRTGEAGL